MGILQARVERYQRHPDGEDAVTIEDAQLDLAEMQIRVLDEEAKQTSRKFPQ